MAEVLITLGIVGVVAALTIPNLMHSIRTKVLETQFKNSTAKLNQAIKRAKYELDVDTLKLYCLYWDSSYAATHGGVGYVNFNQCSEALFNAYNTKGVAKTIHYRRTFYNVDRSNGEIKNFNGTKNINIGSAGMLDHLYSMTRMLDSSYVGFYANNTLFIGIDINGKSGPNKLGHDVFSFALNNNDILSSFKPDGNIYMAEDLTNYSPYDNAASNEYGRASRGNPCNLKSDQILNGWGCGWYALHDICPQDEKPGYFRCLPR